MKIPISSFQTRSDLETHIRNTYGENIDANRVAGHTIEGTKEELTNFGLSTSTTIYGIQSVVKSE